MNNKFINESVILASMVLGCIIGIIVLVVNAYNGDAKVAWLAMAIVVLLMVLVWDRYYREKL